MNIRSLIKVTAKIFGSPFVRRIAQDTADYIPDLSFGCVKKMYPKLAASSM
jgi:hypothetical protein